MNKSEKTEFVSQLSDDFKNSSAVILAHYHGLSVEKITALRKELHSQGIVFKVAKNSLAKLAIIGTNYESLDSLFVGPTVIAFAQEPASLAKCLVKFSEQNQALKIVGGVVDSKIFDNDNIKLLASLPSLDELRAKLVGVINAPAGRLVGVLQGAAGQLVRVLSAYSTKE